MHLQETLPSIQLHDITCMDIGHEFEKLIAESESSLLEKEYVHKQNLENVFIRDIRVLFTSESQDKVITLFHIPRSHPFFFEHSKDHVPGLMLVDAGKQAGTAMCHKIYNVSFDHVFILDQVTIRFMRLASLTAPLFAYNHITDKKFRNKQLCSLQAEGYFFQEGEKVAYMKSCWKIIDPVIFNRIKNR
jgi:2-oxo-3-(phosphooxy)propyl 3-oxoalkanoate synthase